MKKSIFIWSAISVAALVACGGGGGGGAASSDLTITGPTATGAPIINGAVEFVCASGTKTGTTVGDGTYKITVTGGVLPCVGKVTASDGAVYHTVVPASSAADVTANITPMTELVVASIAGTDPAAYYATFKDLSPSDKKAAVTAAKINTAQAEVKATLSNAGITSLGGTDLLSGTLKPGVSGDAYDTALDTLKTKLADARQTIQDLSNAVATASSGGSASSGSTGSTADTPSLPPDLLLKPKAATCAALRSGTYRFVSNQGADKVTVDAKELTITNSRNDVFYGKAVDGDNCHFQGFSDPARTAANPSDLVVSQSGVVVVRSSNGDGTFTVAIMFPEQTGLNTLANAAGKWNSLSIEPVSRGASTYAGHLVQSEWGATGTASSLNYCGSNNDWDNSQCLPLTGTDAANATGTVSVNTTDNGYNITSQGQITPGGRRFVYRTGSGDVLAVGFWRDGSFDVSTKQRTLAAPVVSTTGADSWTLAEDEQLLAKPLTSGTTRVKSVVDPTLATTNFVRSNVTTGSDPSDLHDETLANNTPYIGFRLRAAGTDNGVTYSRLIQLPLKGLGITASLNETNKRFQLSANKPTN